MLSALWVSGLSVVFVDTGFDPATLAELPKMLLKLLTVSVLTANGVVLHVLAFPVVAARVRPTIAQAILLSASGALSTSHWLLAAFVGIARPLGQWPIETLLRAYLAYSGATLVIAAASVPALRYLLGRKTHSRPVLEPQDLSNEVDVLLMHTPGLQTPRA